MERWTGGVEGILYNFIRVHITVLPTKSPLYSASVYHPPHMHEESENNRI